MSQSDSEVELVTIIGSGPAGWTAALYASRANLNPMVLEGLPKQDPSWILPGGQLMLTTEVENYPGYPEGVKGPDMMADFKKQAERFGTRVEARDVASIALDQRPFTLNTVDGNGEQQSVASHSVIIATGATANWLGLENEARLANKGVSACAVCDGALPIFRDQVLVVVGGGDSAMEESSYLSKFASKVYVIHRRDQFRASKVMQQRVLDNPKIKVIWNTMVVDILGEEKVEAVRLEDVRSKEQRTLECGGYFAAIGHTPAVGFLKPDQLEQDEKGYIKMPVAHRSFTSVEGVFTAGDVSDSIYRQAITAAGMGCRAAIDAERWLADHGIE